MKQNGIVVYLVRELSKLETCGRPLSKGGIEKIRELYEVRHKLYENAADVVIETHEDVKECARRLEQMIKNKIPQLF